MRIILATFIAAAVLYGTPARADAPVGAGKLYSGPEGETVAVIPLTAKGPKGEKQALLHVQGTDSDFDGKALLHVVNETSRSADYITQYKGNNYYTLVMRESYGNKKYELFVPGKRDGLRVSFDEKRSAALKGEDVYKLHQKQQSDGTLGKLAAFNRKEREGYGEEGLGEELKAMNTACGTQVTASIDWKSVSDEVIKTYSIASYCSNPISALRRLCDSAAAKKIIQSKVKKLSCQFGPALKLEVKSGSVSWTTAVDVANQEEFATQFFEKNL
jgi:hypothetical protein